MIVTPVSWYSKTYFESNASDQLSNYFFFRKLYEAEEDGSSKSVISFNVPRDLAKGFVNNKKEVYKFRHVNNCQAKFALIKKGFKFR